jgi:outer membrane protein OmpA-like peptidoglycan-associated protein
MPMRGLQLVLALLPLALAAPAVRADDVAGSADHPLVGRFAGATIIGYKAAALDQAALLQAPHDYGALLDRDALADRSGPEWLPLEGRVTRIRYEMPPGHAALEVARSYEAALTAQGFTIVFECADAQCLTGSLTDDYLLGQQLDTDNYDTTRYATHLHYFLAMQGGGKAGGYDDGFYESEPVTDMGGPGSDMGGPGLEMGGPGSEADSPAFEMSGPGFDQGGAPFDTPFDMGPAATQPTYVAILVGEDQALTTAFVEVVEPPAGSADAAANIAVLGTQQMATTLDAGQSVNIYGLHFAHDSAALQPDSRPTLDQIAQLLAAQPQLRLAVIGHTDNQGSAGYNLDLSQRRARSVVAALVGEYGVAPDRLLASGQGYNQPVASNDTEEGRAQNRRVELVAQP